MINKKKSVRCHDYLHVKKNFFCRQMETICFAFDEKKKQNQHWQVGNFQLCFKVIQHMSDLLKDYSHLKKNDSIEIMLR